MTRPDVNAVIEIDGDVTAYVVRAEFASNQTNAADLPLWTVAEVEQDRRAWCPMDDGVTLAEALRLVRSEIEHWQEVCRGLPA